MLKYLAIDELKVGMFVKDIILKDSDHKVKNQGVVNSQRTIELLKKQGVVRVVIECEQANDDNENKQQSPVIQEAAFKDELPKSCQIYDDATSKIKELFITPLEKQSLSPESMSSLANEITNSLMRNEYAITILTRVRQQSFYQWEHAINCGVLACGFALYLGLKKETVREVTLGALLHDIGSAKVAKAILEKPNKLTANEMSVVKKHVFWGVEVAKREGFTSPIVLDMIVNHHERLDGSGYPRGLEGKKISKLSRITAIIDVYDAITGDKPYKKGELPQVAFRQLLSAKDKFDADLVQQFIKYLSIHPVGSLVKLSNDKLGLVVSCNRKNPLKPTVNVIYNLSTSRYVKAVEIDLEKEDINIEAAVKASDYEINLNKMIKDLIA